MKVRYAAAALFLACFAQPHPNMIRDLSGAECKIPETGKKAALLIFIAHDCPVANGYAPEINRIVSKYGPKGIACFVVYVEPDLAVEDARKHAREYGYPCRAVQDTSHQLVARTGVKVTPEAAVLGRSGSLLYRGRIDDLYPALGKRRIRATHTDLRSALDAIIKGERPNPRMTVAIGCFIPGVK